MSTTRMQQNVDSLDGRSDTKPNQTKITRYPVKIILLLIGKILRTKSNGDRSQNESIFLLGEDDVCSVPNHVSSGIKSSFPFSIPLLILRFFQDIICLFYYVFTFERLPVRVIFELLKLNLIARA